MKTNLTWLNLAIFRHVHQSILLCQAITSPTPYLSPWYCVKQYHALSSLLTIVSSNVTPHSLQQYHDPYHISHPSLPPYLWGEQCDSQYLPLYTISSNNTPLPPSLLSWVSCYVKFSLHLNHALSSSFPPSIQLCVANSWPIPLILMLCQAISCPFPPSSLLLAAH